MRLSDLLNLARGNLSRARMRTALTAIGVAIGTAAVVTLVSVGNGTESFAISRAASFGQLTLVEVQPYTPRHKGADAQPHTLTPATLRSLRRLPHVDAVAAWLAMPPLRLSVGARSRDLPAVTQLPITESITMVTRFTGNNTGVLVPDTAAHGMGLAPSALIGRQVTLTAGGSVCCNTGGGGLVVLGPDRHFSARIAGVYAASSWNAPGGDPNIDRNTAPLLLTSPLGANIMGTLRSLFGAAFLAQRGYDLSFVHVDDARETATVAHNISAMNYQVFDRADLLAQVHTVFAVVTAGLGAIGGIALLVAAVGIANTMIMTILERTREIGIMKALGAEPGMVRRMFLIETALVGLIGGVIGVALAALGGLVGNTAFHLWLKGQGVTDAPGSLFLMPVELIAGAIVLAIAVSLAAGAWPSRRAVSLQPLDALRYE